MILSPTKKCCGCGACAHKCPKRCISMQMDEEGFYYPIVDSLQCIECGVCRKICPINRPIKKRPPCSAYAMQNKDITVLTHGSSGGVFGALAHKVIVNGGVVFGARFDSNWDVILAYEESLSGLPNFYGSKYVQVKPHNVYDDVARFLKAGRVVLFSGTPCQIAGLKSSLSSNDCENLILVEIACHGVPSPLLWRRFLAEVNIDNIRDIRFRDKRNGWKDYRLSILGGIDIQKEYTKGIYDCPYLHGFVKNLTQRPSCYSCRFKQGKSGADITMGDFWSIGEDGMSFDKNKGVSAVVFWSKRGEDWFPFDSVSSMPTSFKSIISDNEGFSSFILKHPNRDIFYKKMKDAEKVSKLLLDSLYMPLWYKCLLKTRKIIANL